MTQGFNTTTATLPSYKWTTTNYAYNPRNNELLSYTVSGTTVNFGYDTNGRLVSKNINGSSHWAYSWNLAGSLAKVNNDAGVQGFYAYDSYGRRLEAQEGSTTTFYAYLGTETLAERAGSVSFSTTDFVRADGMLVARFTQGGAPVYYSSDALGSTRLVTDSNGNVVFSDNYQPFGQDNGIPSGSETYKFTGKPVSATTGLYYDYQRWYDSSIGRFISQDPLAGVASDPQSLNGYVYVQNQPTVLIDPTGLCAEGPSGDYLCQGGTELFPSASYWNYDKINTQVSDSQIRQACMDNPGLCGDFLKSGGYNPDDFVAGGGGSTVPGDTISPIGTVTTDPVTPPPTITEAGELVLPRAMQFPRQTSSITLKDSMED